MRTEEELRGVTELGSGHTVYQNTYAPEVLESFPNKHEEAPYMVKLNCPEFTSLCPKTGQPDFGRIVISYIPDHKLVEKQIPETLPVFVPEQRGFPRRLREHHQK